MASKSIRGVKFKLDYSIVGRQSQCPKMSSESRACSNLHLKRGLLAAQQRATSEQSQPIRWRDGSSGMQPAICGQSRHQHTRSDCAPGEALESGLERTTSQLVVAHWTVSYYLHDSPAPKVSVREANTTRLVLPYKVCA